MLVLLHHKMVSVLFFNYRTTLLTYDPFAILYVPLSTSQQCISQEFPKFMVIYILFSFVSMKIMGGGG